MKQQTPTLRRASGLLLAAAALPFAPLAAQETQPPADPPVQTTPPPTQTAETPPPATATPEPAETPTPTAETTPTRTTTSTRTTRTTRVPARFAPAPRAIAPRPAPAPMAAPAPIAAPDSAPIAAGPIEPPATVPPTATPDVLPETPPAATAADVVPAQEPENGGSILPWLIGALLLGAAAFFLLRRRRRDTAVYDEVYEERAAPVAPVEAPVARAEPIPVAPIVAAPVAVAPIAAAAVESGSPSIELLVRPLRAGVTGDDAVVEFELIVGNNGTAPARDVRISTWMFASGTSGKSEMERALIQRPSEASLPEVTIDAGDGRRIESTVQLATAGLAGDAVLPVVVADARYRLPDGGEGHTSASFAVGVPDGAELAHFGIDNPSGLHEGVEARQIGEPQGA